MIRDSLDWDDLKVMAQLSLDEHEGMSLSHKDRFVITPYLYSYQTQPLETICVVA
jgi:hypothetical protein